MTNLISYCTSVAAAMVLMGHSREFPASLVLELIESEVLVFVLFGAPVHEVICAQTS